MVLNSGRPGLAFGVFRCNDAREKSLLLGRMRQALRNIKDASEETKIPASIEFAVSGLPEGIAALSLDHETELVAKTAELVKKGANYIIRAALPGATNAEAADELGFAFNCLYGGTELFDAENEGRTKLLLEVFFKEESGTYSSKLEKDLGK